MMDELAFAAVFGPRSIARARWTIWSASQALGCGSAASTTSIAPAAAERSPPTHSRSRPSTSAPDLPHRTPGVCAALERDAGAVIFEIAKSEMAYTDQRPGRVHRGHPRRRHPRGWRGPVFLQGDHFQFNATKWAAYAGGELEGLRDLTREAIGAGFLNIDIDSSTLVDLSLPTVVEQQRVNAENTAELTRLVRALQPDGVTISVGGEIGEVGKANSTEEELRAYLDGYLG